MTGWEEIDAEMHLDSKEGLKEVIARLRQENLALAEQVRRMREYIRLAVQDESGEKDKILDAPLTKSEELVAALWDCFRSARKFKDLYVKSLRVSSDGDAKWEELCADIMAVESFEKAKE